MSSRLSVVPYRSAYELSGFGYRLTNLELNSIGGVQTEYPLQDEYWVVRFGYKIPIGLGPIGISVVTQDKLIQFLEDVIPFDIGDGLSLFLRPESDTCLLRTRTRIILQRNRLDWITPRSDYLYVEVRYYRDPRRGNTFFVKFGFDAELIRFYTTIALPFNLPNEPLYFLVSAQSPTSGISRHEITYLEYFAFSRFLPGNAEPLVITAGDYCLHGLVKGFWRDNFRGTTKVYDLYLRPLQVKNQGFTDDVFVSLELVVDGYFREAEPEPLDFDLITEFSLVANKQIAIECESVFAFVLEPVPPIEHELTIALEKVIKSSNPVFIQDFEIGSLVVEDAFLTLEPFVSEFEVVVDLARFYPEVVFSCDFVVDCFFQEEIFNFVWSLVSLFEVNLLPQILPIRHEASLVVSDETTLTEVVGKQHFELVSEFGFEFVFLRVDEIITELILELALQEVQRETIVPEFVVEFLAVQIAPIELFNNSVLDLAVEEVKVTVLAFELVAENVNDAVLATELITTVVTEFGLEDGKLASLDPELIAWFEVIPIPKGEILFELVSETSILPGVVVSNEFALVAEYELNEIEAYFITSDLVLEDTSVFLKVINPLPAVGECVIDKLILEVPHTDIESLTVTEFVLDIPIPQIIATELVVEDRTLFREVLSNPLEPADVLIDLVLRLTDQIELVNELLAEVVVTFLPPIFVGENVINCEALYYQVFDIYYDQYCLLSIQSRVDQTFRIPDTSLGCNVLAIRTFEQKADIGCILETTSYIGGELN